MTINDATDHSELRQRAIKRLKKRRDFGQHLLVYTLINGFLVGIWALTDAHGFFWPIFPLLGWGVAVILNAWDVFRRDDLTEEEIHREEQRLQGVR